MVKGRWIGVIAAVVVGMVLVWVTQPDRSQRSSELSSQTAVRDAEQADGVADQGEAGLSVAVSPYGEDPGQRKAIAAMMADVEQYSEDQWMRRFQLTERSGEKIGSEELKGQPFIASFFFSRCPGSCKQQNDQMRLLQQKYRDRPIRLVSISVDPENDTPEVLSAYANEYAADKNKWLFFTGDIQYIAKMAGEVFLLGQIGVKSHPDRFCLFDAQGKLVGKYNWHEATELAQLDKHVEELLAAQPMP